MAKKPRLLQEEWRSCVIMLFAQTDFWQHKCHKFSLCMTSGLFSVLKSAHSRQFLKSTWSPLWSSFFIYNYQVSVLSCTALVLIYSIPTTHCTCGCCVSQCDRPAGDPRSSHTAQEGPWCFPQTRSCLLCAPWMLKVLDAAAEVLIFPLPWNNLGSVACRNMIYITENIYINIIHRYNRYRYNIIDIYWSISIAQSPPWLSKPFFWPCIPTVWWGLEKLKKSCLWAVWTSSCQ